MHTLFVILCGIGMGLLEFLALFIIAVGAGMLMSEKWRRQSEHPADSD